MKTMLPITWPVAALAVLAFVGTVATFAAQASPASEARALFRSELAACTSSTAQQARATCEQEARAAHAQNLRGALADRDPRYGSNSAQRCDALAGAEKLACTQRMQGRGTTSGSAATGGIYRELVTPDSESTAAQ